MVLLLTTVFSASSSVDQHPTNEHSSRMIFDQEEDEELRDDKYRSKSTNFETFVNIVKSNIGSGILGMPFAFRNSGVLVS